MQCARVGNDSVVEIVVVKFNVLGGLAVAKAFEICCEINCWVLVGFDKKA